MTNKKCSIIIPTFNRADRLDRILLKLSQQIKVELIGEVIVCDSNSKDHTKTIIEKAKNYFSEIDIKYLHTENNISKKRNLGIQAAEYEYLIFFDDDCEPLNNCIEQHIVSLENSEMVIFSGIVKFPDDQVSKDNYIRYRNSRHRFYDNYSIDDSICYKEIVTMNMSAKKNEILAAQLFFDDTFLSYGMEDNEFGYRASLNGFNLSVCQATIIHHDRHDLTTFKKKIYSTARDGTGRLLEKYPEAVWGFYYSKYFELDYPHKSFFSRFMGILFRFFLSDSISSIITGFLAKTNHLDFLNFKYLYKYVLACEYQKGVKERFMRYKTNEDIKEGFF